MATWLHKPVHFHQTLADIAHTYCGNTYHFPDRCPCCPFPTVHLSNDNASQRDDRSTLLTCRYFNNSTCQCNPCRYQHCGPHSPCIQMQVGASSPLQSWVLGPILPYDHSSSSANLLITLTKLWFSSLFLTYSMAVPLDKMDLNLQVMLYTALQYPTIIDESLK